MKALIYTFTIIIITSCKTKEPASKKYDLSDRANILALNENIIGQEYIIKKSLKNEIEEYHVNYLGKIKNVKGINLKFITNVIYCGRNTDSPRASASLYIYDDKNQKLGLYGLGATWSLPNRIVENNIIFDYSDEHCNQKTSINFYDSIPNEIFIRCSDKGGDIYSFVKEQTN